MCIGKIDGNIVHNKIIAHFKIKRQTLFLEKNHKINDFCRILCYILSMKNILIFSVLISLFLITSCSYDSGPTVVKKIKYEVTGTIDQVDIRYTNFTRADDNLSNVTLPWSLEFSIAIEYNSSFSAHVYARKFATGSITAQIYVDDVLVKTSTNSGSYPSSSLYYIVWNY